MHDFRQAIRQIKHAPLLSVSVIAVLAIAIGANTAILSALQSLVLREVPWPGAERTLVIWESHPAQGIEREGVSGRTYLDWREHSKSFEQLALVEVGTGTVTGVGEPRQLPGLRVSANFFDMAGAKPHLGRLFQPRDAGSDQFQPMVVLTYDAWKSRFGADPGVVGRTLTVDLMPVTIIGVAGSSFWTPVECEAVVVWPDAVLRRQRRNERHFAVFGRLRPGMSAASAQAELAAISSAQNDPLMRGWSTSAAPVRDILSEGLRPSLWALLGAAALVLLSGCANIANLLLARALARRQEISVRMALGANRGRLARQFLLESASLGLIGGAAGLLLADWLLSLSTRFLPQTIALRSGGGEVVLRPIELSPGVALLSLAIALLTAFLFGLAPLWEALRTDLRGSLSEGSRGSTARSGQIRPALLAFQIAFTLVLLGGASLLTRNYLRMQQADLGFHRDRILTLSIELPTDTRYREVAKVRQFYEEAARRIREVPGVESAGFTSVLPLTPDQDHAQFRLETETAPAGGDAHAANFRAVTPGYFETLGIRLLQGRAVAPDDTADRQPVVWIDQTLRDRHFSGRNPLGRAILLGSRRFEIAGVVASSRQDALRHAAIPTLFFAHHQMSTFRMTLAARTQSEPLRMLAAVKRAIWSVDKDIPVYRVAAMQDWFDASTRNSRLVLLLIGVFAVASLSLAAVGTYGVVAYQAEARTREFSIRLALGARPAQIIGLMLRQTLWIALGGASAGVAACFLALRPLQSLLYDLDPVDPLSLGFTVVLLLTVALLAALRPALRTTRHEAGHALRSQ